MIVNLRNIFNHPWSVSVNKKIKKYNCSLNCICSWSWSLLTKFDYDSLFFSKLKMRRKYLQQITVKGMRKSDYLEKK